MIYTVHITQNTHSTNTNYKNKVQIALFFRQSGNDYPIDLAGIITIRSLNSKCEPINLIIGLSIAHICPLCSVVYRTVQRYQEEAINDNHFVSL